VAFILLEGGGGTDFLDYLMLKNLGFLRTLTCDT